MHSDKLLLGKMGLREAETLRAKLAKVEIELALIHNGGTCNKGCSVEVEMWCHPDDAPEIGRLVLRERDSVYASMGYQPELAEQVFDPSCATATCPACATVFATNLSACPDCGLGFEVPAGGGHGCG